MNKVELTDMLSDVQDALEKADLVLTGTFQELSSISQIIKASDDGNSDLIINSALKTYLSMIDDYLFAALELVMALRVETEKNPSNDKADKAPAA